MRTRLPDQVIRALTVCSARERPHVLPACGWTAARSRIDAGVPEAFDEDPEETDVVFRLWPEPDGLQIGVEAPASGSTASVKCGSGYTPGQVNTPLDLDFLAPTDAGSRSVRSAGRQAPKLLGRSVPEEIRMPDDLPGTGLLLWAPSSAERTSLTPLIALAAGALLVSVDDRPLSFGLEPDDDYLWCEDATTARDRVDQFRADPTSFDVVRERGRQKVGENHDAREVYLRLLHDLVIFHGFRLDVAF